jgi:peptide subunit release factor 1 (eRF1)
LKLYSRCPHNGLVLFCGNDLVDENGKTDKKLMIDFNHSNPLISPCTPVRIDFKLMSLDLA